MPETSPYASLGGLPFDIHKIIEDPIPPIKWAIEDYLAQDDIAMLSGPSGIGKSHVLLGTGISLASGQSLFGRFRVDEPRCVLYIDCEMSRDELHTRAARMLRGQHYASANEYPKDNLILMPQGRLKLIEGHPSLTGLRKIIEDREIKVILVDSLRRTINGNENDSQISNAFFDVVKSFRDEYGILWVFIHHWNKWGGGEDDSGKTIGTGNARARGSGGWIDMLDTHYSVQASGERHHVVLGHEKSRRRLPFDPLNLWFRHDNPLDEETPFWLEAEPEKEEAVVVEAIKEFLAKAGSGTRKDFADLGYSPKTVRCAVEFLVRKNAIHIRDRMPHGEHIYTPLNGAQGPAQNAQKQ